MILVFNGEAKVVFIGEAEVIFIGEANVVFLGEAKLALEFELETLYFGSKFKVFEEICSNRLYPILIKGFITVEVAIVGGGCRGELN